MSEAHLSPARTAALSVFTSTIPTLIERLKLHFPDEEHRGAYTKKVYRESQEQSAHMFSMMYLSVSTNLTIGLW